MKASECGSPCLREQELALLEFIRELGFGLVTVRVADGLPLKTEKVVATDRRPNVEFK